MKTKVILIVSKSVMKFGRDGVICGETKSPEIDPTTFTIDKLPDYCVADMEHLMMLPPGSSAFEVYRDFSGVAANDPRFVRIPTRQQCAEGNL